MTENNSEGWTWIIGTPKWHYMRKRFFSMRKMDAFW